MLLRPLAALPRARADLSRARMSRAVRLPSSRITRYPGLAGLARMLTRLSRPARALPWERACLRRLLPRLGRALPALSRVRSGTAGTRAGLILARSCLRRTTPVLRDVRTAVPRSGHAASTRPVPVRAGRLPCRRPVLREAAGRTARHVQQAAGRYHA